MAAAVATAQPLDEKAVQLHAAILSDRNINQHQLQHSPHRPDTRRLHPGRTSTRPTQLLRFLFMDRLVETVAAYLCRHRSLGLLRLTLGLTRHRLDLFAEVGAVEVVKSAVAPPTPGAEARRIAVREVACRPRRGLAQEAK